MILERILTKWLVLLCLLILLFANIPAQDVNEIDREIIVLFEMNRNVRSYPHQIKRVKEYLPKLIWGNLNEVHEDDVIKINKIGLFKDSWTSPLISFEKDNQRLQFLEFGVDDDQIDYNDNPEKYLSHFSCDFFKSYELSDFNEYQGLIDSITSIRHNYYLKDQLFSLIQRKLFNSSEYIKDLLVVVFSDFTPQEKTHFESAVPGKYRKYFNKLWSDYSNNFIEEEIFQLKLIDYENDKVEGKRQRLPIFLKAIDIKLKDMVKISWRLHDEIIGLNSGKRVITLPDLDFAVSNSSVTSDFRNLKLRIFGNNGYEYSVDGLTLNKGSVTKIDDVDEYELYSILSSDIVIDENMEIPSTARLQLVADVNKLVDEETNLGSKYIVESEVSIPLKIANPEASVWRYVIVVAIILLVLYWLMFRKSVFEISFFPEGIPNVYWTPDSSMNVKTIVSWNTLFLFKRICKGVSDSGLGITKSANDLTDLSQKTKGETVSVILNNYIPNREIFTLDCFKISLSENEKTIKSRSFSVQVFRPTIDVDYLDKGEDLSFICFSEDQILEVEYSKTSTSILKIPIEIKLAENDSNPILEGSIGVNVKIDYENDDLSFNLESDEKVVFNRDAYSRSLIVLCEIPLYQKDFKNPGENDIQEFTISAEGIGFPQEYPLFVTKTFKYILVPNLDKQWIAIDPGTTGSCIVGYDSEQMHVGEFTGEQNRLYQIMPSICCYPNNQKNPKIGFEAYRYMDLPDSTIFRSVKKIIGYNYTQSIKLGNNKSKEITGEEAAEYIIKYLMEKFIAQKLSHIDNYMVNKIIVAVPNIFTVNKISELKKCIPSSYKINGKTYNILEKRHIYEAESIAVYLINERKFTYKSGVLLICDFGGGTVNMSVIKITIGEKNDNIELNILSRVGCAVGGDVVTQLIAEYLWKRISKIKDFIPDREFNPFKSNGSNSQNKITRSFRNVKQQLYTISEEIKIELSNRMEEIKNGSDYINEKEDKFFDKSITTDSYTLKLVNDYSEEYEIHNDAKVIAQGINFNNILYEIFSDDSYSINYTKLICDIFEDAVGSLPDDEKITDVVFTGRASKLPHIERTIKEKIKDDKIEFISLLDEAERKLAVCKGAAYYASQNETIKLTRDKALANYIVQIEKDSKPIKIIDSNDEFNGKSNLENVELDVPLGSSNVISFYKLIGNIEQNHDNATVATGKKSRLGNITLHRSFRNRGEVGKINIKVSLDLEDNFEAEISNNVHTQSIEEKIVIDDLYKELGESATWFLS